jgi:hypothetical protein
MEQRGSGDHAGKDAFNRIYPEMRIEIAQRAIGKDKPYIKPNE